MGTIGAQFPCALPCGAAQCRARGAAECRASSSVSVIRCSVSRRTNRRWVGNGGGVRTASSSWEFLPRGRRAVSGVSTARTGTGRRARATPSLGIRCVGWDPENILAPPQSGHIARRKFEKQFTDEEERKAAIEQAARAERDRRRALREARVVPPTNTGLVEFFMETEGQEMEYEIARCRPRLNEGFFRFLKAEIGLLRFALDRSKDSEDQLIELEALQKVLGEGVEAYDKLATDMTGAKDRLTQILSSKDKRGTLLELAGENKLDRPLLALLDENIVTASNAGQKDAAEFMGKIRAAMLKYMTV